MSIIIGANVSVSDEAEAKASAANPGVTHGPEGRDFGFKQFLDTLTPHPDHGKVVAYDGWSIRGSLTPNGRGKNWWVSSDPQVGRQPIVVFDPRPVMSGSLHYFQRPVRVGAPAEAMEEEGEEEEEDGVVGKGAFGTVVSYEYRRVDARDPATVKYPVFVAKISGDPEEATGLSILKSSGADAEVVMGRIIADYVISRNPTTGHPEMPRSSDNPSLAGVPTEYKLFLPIKGDTANATSLGYVRNAGPHRFFVAMEPADGTLADFYPNDNDPPSVKNARALTSFRNVYGMFQDIAWVHRFSMLGDDKRIEYELVMNPATLRLERKQKDRLTGILMTDVKPENFLWLKRMRAFEFKHMGLAHLKLQMRIFPCDFGSFTTECSMDAPKLCSTEYRSPADEYLHVGVPYAPNPEWVTSAFERRDPTGGTFPSIGHVAFCLGVTLMNMIHGPLHGKVGAPEDFETTHPGFKKEEFVDQHCIYRVQKDPTDNEEWTVRPWNDTKNMHPQTYTDEEVLRYLRLVRYTQYTLNVYEYGTDARLASIGALLYKLLNFRHVGRYEWTRNGRGGKKKGDHFTDEDMASYMAEKALAEEDEEMDDGDDETRGPYTNHKENFEYGHAGNATVRKNMRMLDDAIARFVKTGANRAAMNAMNLEVIDFVDAKIGVPHGETMGDARGLASLPEDLKNRARHKRGNLADDDVRFDPSFTTGAPDWRFCPVEDNPDCQTMEDIDRLFTECFDDLIKAHKLKGKLFEKRGLLELPEYPESAATTLRDTPIPVRLNYGHHEPRAKRHGGA